MVRFKQNYLGAGLLKLMVSFRRDPEYRACIDGSAYGSGSQQAMVCLWQWSASDDDPLQTMDHWMAVVRRITRSALRHWFASSDSLRSEPAHDNGQFMAVVQGHGYLMQRLSRKLAPLSAMVEHNARASFGSG